MKPLSERDENQSWNMDWLLSCLACRNEATLWKRWEPKNKKGWLLPCARCRNEATLWKRWERLGVPFPTLTVQKHVGMKPLSERDENQWSSQPCCFGTFPVGMKPLSERDENKIHFALCRGRPERVGMKPLSERDENGGPPKAHYLLAFGK